MSEAALTACGKIAAGHALFATFVILAGIATMLYPKIIT
jgi:hypothetical protein